MGPIVYLGLMTVRVRFAPSPSGSLHVGNVRTALYNWLFANQNKGVFILRIEDTDRARSKTHYEQQLSADLRWLGLCWDEGTEVGGNCGPYRQRERYQLYQKEAARLLAQEKAYPCFCLPQSLEEERTRQLSAGEQPRYSGKCRTVSPREARRRLAAGEQATLRFKVRQGNVSFEDRVFGNLQAKCTQIGDFVLLRSDGSAQYNFACPVDDALMHITHVIRGEGHISNTYRQLLVYESLAIQPPEFAHLSTILGKDGGKLSKRHGATSVAELRQQGYLPQAVLNYLALLGWTPHEEKSEILSLEELVAEFDLPRVHRSPATFDPEKLNWVNRNHFKRLARPQRIQLATPYLQAQGRLPSEVSAEVNHWVGDLIDTVLNHLDKLEDVLEASDLIFHFDPRKCLARPEVIEVLAESGAREVMAAFCEAMGQQVTPDSETFQRAVREVKERTGQKGRLLFHPIRVALTARCSGPELEKLFVLIERGKQLDLPVKVLGVKERVESLLSHLS